MKGFIATSILFLITISGILINHFHASLFHQEITNLIDTLSDEPGKENTQIIQDIAKNWNQRSIWLSLSVERKDLISIKNHIDELYIHNLYEDELQMAVSKNQLLNSIDSMLGAEKLYWAPYIKINFNNLSQNQSFRLLFR